MQDRPVERVYKAQSADESRRAYDAWAETYEADLCAMGYRIPAIIAATFTRFVPPETTPILDAGCGGGIQTEALAQLGYTGFVGIDLSEGMLEIARRKGIYKHLQQQALGPQLPFADNHFGAVISAGTITPGHAPPESLDEFVRITRPGAPIVFSLRSDRGQVPAYLQTLERLTRAGQWRHIFSTDSFQSMPYGEPEILNRIHVYEVV